MFTIPTACKWQPPTKQNPTTVCPGLDHIFIRLGPAPPFPHLLHCCSVFLSAPMWELFSGGNQYDNTRSQLQMFKLTLRPKLYDINLHNVTHFLISRYSRGRMLVVKISLLIVTFLSLISHNLSWMQATQEVNPHPRIAPCANM